MEAGGGDRLALTSPMKHTMPNSPAPPSARTSSGGANATADRAIEILLLFSQDKPVWTPQEISAHFEMPRSTTYRYLTSLRSNSLIVQDGRGTFSLGPRLLHMAQVAKMGNPVIAVASVPMHELAERFNENVVLNERVGQELIALERIDSPKRIVLKSTRSHLTPWPATASAKVLLAFCEPVDFDALVSGLTPVSYTEQTITDLDRLLQHLEDARLKGFAVSDEERDEGVWGVSAPILEGERCRYALSVVGPKFRIPPAQRNAIVKAVVEAAQRISLELG